MTGYAYQEAATKSAACSVEMKSYNSRSLDMTMNLPPALSRLEPEFRKMAEAEIRRGKVDISVKVKYVRRRPTLWVNTEAAKVWAEALGSLAREIGSPGGVSLELIARQEGVLVVENDDDDGSLRAAVEPVFRAALGELLAHRAREGERLLADIGAQLDVLDGVHRFFSDWQPKMDDFFRAVVAKRFAELAETVPAGTDLLSEQRILTETAALLVKYTINEEIIRLAAHLEALRAALTEDAPGRRIDFICQEINREINTIGAKNQAVEMGQRVITAKTALENLREQARNVE
jgi:uncharacterized protein (TIGR00255 family)